MSVLERDVCIREMSALKQFLYLREMSVLERDVCIREMSVLERCLCLSDVKTEHSIKVSIKSITILYCSRFYISQACTCDLNTASIYNSI